MEPAPASTSKRWFFVRLAFIAFFAPNGFVLARAVDRPPAWMVIFVFVASIHATLSILREGVRREPQRNWSSPTWFTNPFSGPAHGFHLASCMLLGFGAAGLVPIFYRQRSLLSIPLFPFVFGLGVYCGVRVFYRYFHDGTSKA